jgi:hypothetical protein
MPNELICTVCGSATKENCRCPDDDCETCSA